VETNSGKPIGRELERQRNKETGIGKIERGRQKWTKAEFDLMERDETNFRYDY
jgi:hypothetical protein